MKAPVTLVSMIACPACAGENPAGFKFCGFCGGPLEAAPPPAPAHETRRSVTIVFSDLVGSTALGERIDSEAVREILKRYFEEMSGALELHGGTVEKFIGDAIMAVFGMPVAHEDDALRAARATLEMKARLAVLNEELELRWGVTLANRTGINTGSVIASGDASTRQGLVAGDTVNTAARLEQAAPPYEVLIGEPTYRLLRGAVEVEEVEPLELKGKAERVPAYRLLAVTEAGSPPRRTDLPLIGRERELGLLTETLEAAISASAPRFVTLFAEAGTGKSRLIEELMALTTERGGLAVRGRCLPYGRGITFWPLVEIVGQAAEIADDDSPEAARAKIAELAGDGAVAERIAVTVGLSEAKFPLDELFWGVRKFLESLSRSANRSSPCSRTSTGPRPRCSICSRTSARPRPRLRSFSSAPRGPISSRSSRTGRPFRAPSGFSSSRSRAKTSTGSSSTCSAARFPRTRGRRSARPRRATHSSSSSS